MTGKIRRERLLIPAALISSLTAVIYCLSPEFTGQAQYLIPLFRSFGMPTAHALFRNGLDAVVFLWMVFLAFGTGFALLRISGINIYSKFETAILGTALGFGLNGTLFFLSGLAGFWGTRSFSLTLAVLSVISLYSFKKFLNLNLPAGTPELSRTDKCLVSIFFLSAFFYLIGCFMPEIFYDTLVYHLALPDLYLMKGGIIPTAGNMYSGMPMLGEMIYAPCLSLSSDTAARMIHWFFGVLSGTMIFLTAFSFGKSARAGLLAAVLFYSSPVVAGVSWMSNIDFMPVLFLLCSFYCLMTRSQRYTADIKWTILAGIFCGFALASKYTAWPYGLGLFMLNFYSKSGVETDKNLRLSAFAVSAILIMAAWPLKNILFYGNPIYPFMHEYFNQSGPQPDWRGLLMDGHGADLKGIFFSLKGFAGYLTHPWNILAAKDVYTSILGITPAMALPFFIIPSPSLLFMAVKITGIMFWFTWSMTTTMPRFFLPVLPFVCLLTALYTEMIPVRLVKKLSYLTFSLVFITGLMCTAGRLYSFDALKYILGHEVRAGFLSRYHPSYPCGPYPAIEFINNNTAPDAKILLIGEERAYYLRRDYLAVSVFDKNPVLEWADTSADSDELKARFKKSGITHILFNKGKLSVLMSKGKNNFPLSPAGKAVFDGFMTRYSRLVFEYKGKEIYDPWALVFAVY